MIRYPSSFIFFVILFVGISLYQIKHFITKKEIEISGKKISIETGKIARQADGAIIATCGETVVIEPP